MTLAELGSVGELVGAIATVATLLYLALQIRATGLATKRQALDGTIDRIVRWELRLAESPELLRVWIAGTRDYEALDLEDRVRFAAISSEILALLESTLEAVKHGDVKAETGVATKAFIENLLRNPGFRDYWTENGRHKPAADFVEVVDAVFEATSTQRPSAPGPLPLHMPIED